MPYFIRILHDWSNTDGEHANYFVLLRFNFILFRETQSEDSLICKDKVDMDTLSFLIIHTPQR